MGLLKSITGRFADMRQRSANVEVFKKTLFDAVRDGAISDPEMKDLQSLYGDYGLTLDDLAKMRVAVYIAALAGAKADGVVTAEEEAELHKIQAFLKIEDGAIAGSRAELARLRVIAEIEAGNLPGVAVSGLVLQKNETPHWSEPGALIEERVVSRKFEGRSSGVSFRIAKGVSYRIGASRGNLISETAKLKVSHGDLIVTSWRVIFRGDKKSFTYRLDKLLDVNMFSNGVGVTGENGNPRVVMFDNDRNADIVGSILSAAVNRFES